MASSQSEKIDGTPYAVKVACTVWSGGKAGDRIKGLPIAIYIGTQFWNQGRTQEIKDRVLHL